MMQTTEIVVTLHRCAKSGPARRPPSLRKWFMRLNGWTVAWYALLTVAGILLYKAGAAYAMRERGRYAVGGEVMALMLPVFYYAASVTIRDIIKDWRERF